jgi:hypothetical protein
MHLKDPGGHDPEVQLLESDGDWAVILCSRPFPIGATLAFIATHDGEAADRGGAVDPGSVEPNTAGALAVSIASEYRIKVRGARRHDERSFRVEGRLVSMTKEQRERLLAARSPE